MLVRNLVSYIVSHDMVYLDLDSATDLMFKTPAEIAVLFNTSEAVVNSWIEVGTLKSVEIKGQKLIFIQDLERFMEEKIGIS